MERLFDGNSRYNDVADQVDREIRVAIDPILRKFVDAGYCPRDLHFVVGGAVLDKILSLMLRRAE
jgi:hypothetical protein